jgi:hypothetical protein
VGFYRAFLILPFQKILNEFYAIIDRVFSSTTKVCPKCETEKDLTDFPIQKKNGKPFAYCSTCKKEYAKVYREKKKEEISEYRKVYYKKTAEKAKAYRKDYYQKHHEQERAYRRQYYIDTRSDRIEYSKEYYQSHKEERAAYAKANYDKDKVRAQMRQWRSVEENRLSELERNRQYYLTHPEVFEKSRAIRRANELNARYDFYQKQNLWEQQGGVCHICQGSIKLEEISVDHIKDTPNAIRMPVSTKSRYWTVTGSKHEKKKLRSLCTW